MHLVIDRVSQIQFNNFFDFLVDLKFKSLHTKFIWQFCNICKGMHLEMNIMSSFLFLLRFFADLSCHDGFWSSLRNTHIGLVFGG